MAQKSQSYRVCASTKFSMAINSIFSSSCSRSRQRSGHALLPLDSPGIAIECRRDNLHYTHTHTEVIITDEHDNDLSTNLLAEFCDRVSIGMTRTDCNKSRTSPRTLSWRWGWGWRSRRDKDRNFRMDSSTFRLVCCRYEFVC